MKEIRMTNMSSKERHEAENEVKVLRSLRVSSAGVMSRTPVKACYVLLQHCNVVSYVESWTTRTALYIVMEFCDKGDLEGIVKARRGKLFSEERILDWFVQMCLALKHIHDRKILHRDLKTANIFVMSGGMLKLGDFGIAKVLANTGELAKTAIGTLALYHSVLRSSLASTCRNSILHVA